MNPDILRITYRASNVKSKVSQRPSEALGMTLALTESFSYGMGFAKGGWYKTCRGALGISVRED